MTTRSQSTKNSSILQDVSNPSGTTTDIEHKNGMIISF